MKILHIITGLRLGGAEVALYNRLKAMQADDEITHVVVAFYDGPVAKSIKQLGITVIVVKGLIKGYDPLGVWRLYNLTKDFKPDLIHTSLWAANMVGRFLGYCFAVPVINELHGNVQHEGWIRNLAERVSVTQVDRVVAVAPSVRATYARHILKALPKETQYELENKLVTVTNGIDRNQLLAKIQASRLERSAFDISDDAFVIGAIGRLEPIKSYDVLIRSFAKMRQKLPMWLRDTVRLMLVGDGSERRKLEALTAKLGLKAQVIFTGYRLDAYKFYPLFDCFALSSQSEGLSIALLEALALGIPIITTNLFPQHDAIIQGKNGLLIPVNDIEAYASGLLDLYQQRITKNNDMSPLVDFPFELDKATAAYKAIYKELAPF